ncbi:hypothetical protein HDU78_007502 [Chytriomyces hyalinus]|nr:hypothetical protein HDU78_007502 [Chytriomyces hyalinus]
MKLTPAALLALASLAAAVPRSKCKPAYEPSAVTSTAAPSPVSVTAPPSKVVPSATTSQNVPAPVSVTKTGVPTYVATAPTFVAPASKSTEVPAPSAKSSASADPAETTSSNKSLAEPSPTSAKVSPTYNPAPPTSEPAPTSEMPAPTSEIPVPTSEKPAPTSEMPAPTSDMPALPTSAPPPSEVPVTSSAPSTTATKSFRFTAAPEKPHPRPEPITGATIIHDPSMAQLKDGTYIVVGTGRNIDVKTSKDLVHWRQEADAFPTTPKGCLEYNENKDQIWAPDLTLVDNVFYLYFSCSSFGSPFSAIFISTSKTGLPGSFSEPQLVISSNKGTGYNAIDPALAIFDGEWYMTFGSWQQGIFQARVQPGTGLIIPGTKPIKVAEKSGGLEGVYLYKANGYYYLTQSLGLCCKGADSTYQTSVGRSLSPSGPFVDRNGVDLNKGGALIINEGGHDGVYGPGGSSVYTSPDKGDIIVYHYYLNDGGHVMGINKIEYSEDGWPVMV